MISWWKRWRSASAFDETTGADVHTRRYRDALERVHDGLRLGAGDALATPPAHLRPRIMAAIRSSDARQPAPARRSRAPLALAACAAALVAAFVAIDPFALRTPRAPGADAAPAIARTFESLRLIEFLAPAADVGNRVEQPLICELQNLRQDTSAAFGSLLGSLPAPVHGVFASVRER